MLNLCCFATLAALTEMKRNNASNFRWTQYNHLDLALIPTLIHPGSQASHPQPLLVHQKGLKIQSIAFSEISKLRNLWQISLHFCVHSRRLIPSCSSFMLSQRERWLSFFLSFVLIMSSNSTSSSDLCHQPSPTVHSSTTHLWHQVPHNAIL